MPVRVAIVGSGPSGFYTAEALLKTGADCRIDIIERLAAPFGLIRGGVAPDHQSTKRVSKAFQRTALKEQVRFFGNVEVGRDVSMDELRVIYDAVVLAVGAPVDRPMGIPGDDRQGVYGAAAFVGWYNGEPDFRLLAPDLDVSAAVVVGNGNVALDIARVLVKTPAEMAATDLVAPAAAAIHSSPLSDVYVLGRRGPVEAKFSNVELREMGALEDCRPVVHAAQLPTKVGGDMSDRDRRLKEKNLATFRSFTEQSNGRARRVHFCFYAAPVEVQGADRVTGLKVERTRVVDGRAVGTGAFFTLDCGMVVSAIGYDARPIEGVPFDPRGGVAAHRDGRVADGVYAVGWIKRGPTGVIATNKPDGAGAAQAILADMPVGAKAGRPALEAMLRDRAVRWVSFADWQTIEQAEIANAPPGAPRCKFVTVEDMLAVLDDGCRISR